jgi:acyl dehydratase
MKRSLHLTEAMLQAYSRRGNFHSDPDEARRIGMPGLVAQGMQAAGPAYGLLLDAWGEEFLASGELELKFVGMVVADQTVEAVVEVTDATATITVENVTGGATAVVGSAHRTA